METENTILENPLYEALMTAKVEYHNVNKEREQRAAVLREKEQVLNQEMGRMVKNYLSLLGGGFDYAAKGVRKADDNGFYQPVISWDIPNAKLQIHCGQTWNQGNKELAKHIYNPRFGQKIMEKFSSCVFTFMENNVQDSNIYNTLQEIVSRPLPTLDKLVGQKIKLPSSVHFQTRDNNDWMDAFKIEPVGAMWQITLYYGAREEVLTRTRRWATLEKEFEQVYEECRSFISKNLDR